VRQLRDYGPGNPDLIQRESWPISDILAHPPVYTLPALGLPHAELFRALISSQFGGAAPGEL